MPYWPCGSGVDHSMYSLMPRIGLLDPSRKPSQCSSCVARSAAASLLMKAWKILSMCARIAWRSAAWSSAANAAAAVNINTKIRFIIDSLLRAHRLRRIHSRGLGGRPPTSEHRGRDDHDDRGGVRDGIAIGDPVQQTIHIT